MGTKRKSCEQAQPAPSLPLQLWPSFWTSLQPHHTFSGLRPLTFIKSCRCLFFFLSLLLLYGFPFLFRLCLAYCRQARDNPAYKPMLSDQLRTCLLMSQTTRAAKTIRALIPACKGGSMSIHCAESDSKSPLSANPLADLVS